MSLEMLFAGGFVAVVVLFGIILMVAKAIRKPEPIEFRKYYDLLGVAHYERK